MNVKGHESTVLILCVLCLYNSSLLQVNINVEELSCSSVKYK